MKKLFFLLFFSFIFGLASAQYVVSGGIGEPYAYSEDLAGTGIEKVYLLNTRNNATISYTSSGSVQFYRYKHSLADKIDITTISDGNGNYTIPKSDLLDGYCYLVSENGGIRAGVWIIDYSAHQPVLTSIEAIESEDKCKFLKLFVTKSDDLSFYANNGLKKNIRRKYTIEYENQVWNEKERRFDQKNVVLDEKEIGTEVVIDAPLMDTKFTLKGDQFAKKFNITKEISTNMYPAIAVEAHMFTEQEKRDADNEAGNEKDKLGGSAPVTIDFYGYGNEPVAGFYTWLLYNKQDMKNPIARYTDKDINYTFENWGDYVVKLEVADKSSICTDTISVSFSISDSWIEAPNFFSPGDSPGSNDEFKVAYRSIIKFRCTIFNRWGTKLYQWTDPTKGWDGRYKGNYVTTGVYFYVIEATGSDGVKHMKKGDINVFRSR